MKPVFNKTESDEANTIKQARPDWIDQELRPMKYQGQVVPGYMIAKDGLVISYKRYKEGKPMEWTGAGLKGCKYPSCTIQVPIENLRQTTHSKVHSTNNAERKGKIHNMVADTWGDKMLEEHACPFELKPYWDDFPEELKVRLQVYFNVDHIDDNKLNPHIDNLRYVSPRTNHPANKKQEKNSS